LLIAGIVLNIIDLKRFAKISMVFYLLMGWLIAGASYLLIKKLPANALILLVAGGLLYSIGAILYGLGKKIPYIHTIWHLFVLGGSVLHYLAVYLYVV
jgi:hemolysin III